MFLKRISSGVVFFGCVLKLVFLCAAQTDTPESSRDEECASDIIYLNLFKVLIKDESSLPDVETELDQHGFVYIRPIVSNFYSFRLKKNISESNCPVGRNWSAEINSDKILSIKQDFQRLRKLPPLENPVGTVTDNQSNSMRRNFGDDILQQPQQTVCPPTSGQPSVRVAVLDLGFEMGHPNLKEKINVSLSYNFLEENHNPLPPHSPVTAQRDTYPYFMQDSHGTMCMGVIASSCVARSKCDKGISDHVQLAGLKMISKYRTPADTVEARALVYYLDDIDIVSASYGIPDNRGYHDIEEASEEAFRKGVEEGRDCKGRIYVYPSGNGHIDNCNMDGYAKSVHTLTITNVNQNFELPDNVERCPCTLAAAIVNTKFVAPAIHDSCVDEFTGSSAAVPAAVGHIANMLRVNPALTKRDVEHIIVRTASQIGFNKSVKWNTNGAGFNYSDRVGFGLLHPDHMQIEAKKWLTVPAQRTYVGKANNNRVTIPKTSNIIYLEYVVALLKLCCFSCTHKDTGKVHIDLTSPMQTISSIFTPSVIEYRGQDIRNADVCWSWHFTSVQFWGENPTGQWSVNWTADNSTDFKIATTTLTLYGTAHDPRNTAGSPIACKKVKPTSPPPPPGNTQSNKTWIFIVVAIVILFTSIIIVAVVKKFDCCKRRSRPKLQFQYSRASNDDQSDDEVQIT